MTPLKEAINKEFEKVAQTNLFENDLLYNLISKDGNPVTAYNISKRIYFEGAKSNAAVAYHNEWKYCPECGCEEFCNENQLGEGMRVCNNCGQDWWTDIDYSDVICKKLNKLSEVMKENETLKATALSYNEDAKRHFTDWSNLMKENEGLREKLELYRTDLQKDLSDLREHVAAPAQEGGNPTYGDKVKCSNESDYSGFWLGTFIGKHPSSDTYIILLRARPHMKIKESLELFKYCEKVKSFPELPKSE